MRISPLPLLVATAALALPRVAVAQPCIGVPTSDGQFSLNGNASFTDGAKSFGAGGTANLTGPVSLAAGYELVDFDEIDENANSFGGSAALELSVPDVSICPTAGVTHTRWSEQFGQTDITITETVFPIGLGIGRRFVAGNDFFVTLFGVPQFLHIRGKIEGEQDGVTVSFSEDNNEFGTRLGTVFGTRAFFAGASVFFTTVEDSDPVFTLALGLIFGGA